MSIKLAAAAVAIVALLVVVGYHDGTPAEAATFALVKNGNDAGPGSFRAAIAAASANAGIDTVYFQNHTPVKLDTDVVYTGTQALTVSALQFLQPTVIEGSTANACTDALFVSTGGANLTIRGITFRNSTCGGIDVPVPTSRTGAVKLDLQSVTMRDLNGTGLHASDYNEGDPAPAAIKLSIAYSNFVRAGAAAGQSAVDVAEYGDGNLVVSTVFTSISGSALSGLYLQENESGDLDVSANFLSVTGVNTVLKNAAAIDAREYGYGDAELNLTNSAVNDNGNVGVFVGENDTGDLRVTATRVNILRNGLGSSRAPYGLVLSEYDAGSVSGILTDVSVSGNFGGIDVAESGDTGQVDDLVLRFTRVTLDDNRAAGLTGYEDSPGGFDLRAIQLEVNRNGQSGLVFRENDEGSVRLDLTRASFDGNGGDGLNLDEGGADDLRVRFLQSSASHNAGYGINAIQRDAGTGVLTLLQSTVTANTSANLSLTNVVQN
jgi:hypothetical protein